MNQRSGRKEIDLLLDTIFLYTAVQYFFIQYNISALLTQLSDLTEILLMILQHIYFVICYGQQNEKLRSGKPAMLCICANLG